MASRSPVSQCTIIHPCADLRWRPPSRRSTIARRSTSMEPDSETSQPMELSPEVAVAQPNPSEQNATPTAVSRPATAVIEDSTRSNKKAKKDGDIRIFVVVLPPANKALALDTPPASASVRPPVTRPLPFHSGPVSVRMTQRRRAPPQLTHNPTPTPRCLWHQAGTVMPRRTKCSPARYKPGRRAGCSACL